MIVVGDVLCCDLDGIDKATTFMFIHFVNDKGECFEAIRTAMSEARALTGEWCRLLKCDGEGGYLSLETTNYLKSIGCKRDVSPPYDSNGNISRIKSRIYSAKSAKNSKKMTKMVFFGEF